MRIEHIHICKGYYNGLYTIVKMVHSVATCTEGGVPQTLQPCRNDLEVGHPAGTYSPVLRCSVFPWKTAARNGANARQACLPILFFLGFQPRVFLCPPLRLRNRGHCRAISRVGG